MECLPVELQRLLLLGCRHGIIVYRKELPVGALIGGGTLDFGQPVHDYAQASLLRTSCSLLLVLSLNVAGKSLWTELTAY